MNLRVDSVVTPEDIAASDRSAAGETVGPARVAAPSDRAERDPAAEASAAERFMRSVLPHLDDAYTLACRMTGSRIDAEDVVQDACLRVLRIISRTTGDFNVRSWTLGAVRSAAFAWLRKYRPAALVPPDEFGPFEHDRMRAWESDGATPEAALIAKTDAALLAAAMERLPAPFREALVLRDIHDLSYREIAEVVGVPVGTVMSRLARGRSRLVGMIAGHPR